MDTELEAIPENALTKKQEAKLALFKSKGIENLVHSHELIPIGDGKYKLVAHKDLLSDLSNIDGSHSNGNFSYASRMLGNTKMTPDEEKLFILNGGSDCTVEFKETVAAGSCCR